MNLSPSEIDALGIIAQEKTDRALEVLDAEFEEWKAGQAGRAARLRDADPTAIPPSVTRGELGIPEYVELVLADGEIKQVMKRTGVNGQSAFLDWINFTIHEETVQLMGVGIGITDDDIMILMSYTMEQILGYGITQKTDRGRNFYRTCWVLGDNYGFVLHGGQRNTICVMLNGTGLAAAKPGWERRLYHFLTKEARYPKLTRVDTAHDCYSGEYTVNQADKEFDEGLFKLPKSPESPDCEHLGNWKRPNGKGRTFAVGHRTNGKYARIYEKGKQLGSPTSEWVRIEVEYKSRDRVIPFDILLNPGLYLAGAYPAFEWINETVERIVTTRETVLCTKEKKETWIKHVCGKDLFALSELEGGETLQERCFNLIQRLQKTELPKWADLPDYANSPEPIHLFDGSSVLARNAETSTLRALN